MTPATRSRDLAAIRLLLLECFTPERFRSLCEHHPTFRPILTRLDPKYSFHDLIDEVLHDCVAESLLDEFRAAVEHARPETCAPTPLPAVWNLTHLSNPNFTGREVLLTDLHETLAVARPGLRIHALHGPGGVGKTQIAIHYAYRHRSDYDLIWWIRTEEPETLGGDYAALAAELRLPPGIIADQREAIPAVRTWLSRSARWLLIFDDAPGSDAIRDYLPLGGDGAVLITSHHSAWPDHARPVLVQPFDRDTSIAFLQRRIGQDDPAAGELAAELGNLPLALELAGAYCEATDCTLSTYLDLYHTQHSEFWIDPSAPHDYPHTITTTVKLATRLMSPSPTVIETA